MKNNCNSTHGALSRFFVAGILPAFVLLLSVQASRAGSASWQANPATGDWNTAANWSPATVPNADTDRAAFDISNQTMVSLSDDVHASGITFNPGASGFKIGTGPFVLLLAGAGVTNNSGVNQDFVVRGAIRFANAATAGSLTTFTHRAGESSFNFNASAGSATFILHSAVVNSNGATGSAVSFSSGATADSGTFVINGGTGTGDFDSSVVRFFDGSTAGNATLTANGSSVSKGLGGLIEFRPKSSAGDATLIANGGSGGGDGGRIAFNGTSGGGTARVEVFGNGSLDIASHQTPLVTVGSIEGDGTVLLGPNRLTVGSNNLDTTFSGVISDGNSGGSLTKIGNGTLTLTNANAYNGGTIVKRGKLLVNNKTGSAAGAES